MKLIIAAIAATAAALTGTPLAAAQPAYDDLFYWTDWMADKYNMGTIYVDQAPLESDVYAQSRGRSITYNTRFTNDPELLHRAMVSDVASGFHPGRHCTATQALAAHESAHVLDYVTGYTARVELAVALNEGLSGTVSSYSFDADGNVNLAETLAEAMVAVECDDPTPAQTYIHGLLTS